MRAFRRLMKIHPESLPAGEIARLCGTPHNTVSTHLAILRRAGLISVTKEARSMFYRVDLDGFRALATFLARDCCNGRPEICAPLLANDLAACSCETMDGAIRMHRE